MKRNTGRSATSATRRPNVPRTPGANGRARANRIAHSRANRRASASYAVTATRRRSPRSGIHTANGSFLKTRPAWKRARCGTAAPCAAIRRHKASSRRATPSAGTGTATGPRTGRPASIAEKRAIASLTLGTRGRRRPCPAPVRKVKRPTPAPSAEPPIRRQCLPPNTFGENGSCYRRPPARRADSASTPAPSAAKWRARSYRQPATFGAIGG